MIARIARRLVRKAVKPLLLWVNECKRQESVCEVSRLDARRQDAIQKMQREYLRQVRLQMKRNQIAGW